MGPLMRYSLFNKKESSESVHKSQSNRITYKKYSLIENPFFILGWIYEVCPYDVSKFIRNFLN